MRIECLSFALQSSKVCGFWPYPSLCLTVAFLILVLCSEMLKVGSSKPWQEILFTMTGTRKMDAGALLEYFKPVTEWLEQQNNKTQETLGWPDFEWRPPVPEGYPEGIGKAPPLSLCPRAGSGVAGRGAKTDGV